jgi:hypothetical protein
MLRREVAPDGAGAADSNGAATGRLYVTFKYPGDDEAAEGAGLSEIVGSPTWTPTHTSVISICASKCPLLDCFSKSQCSAIPSCSGLFFNYRHFFLRDRHLIVIMPCSFNRLA